MLVFHNEARSLRDVADMFGIALADLNDIAERAFDFDNPEDAEDARETLADFEIEVM